MPKPASTALKDIPDHLKDAVVVTTRDPVWAILAARNSAAWPLNLKKWGRQLKWLVVLHKTYDGHRQPMLLCPLDAIRRRLDADDPRARYSFEFSRYADISELSTERWEAQQFPVQITSAARVTGLDPDALDFVEPAQPRTLQYSFEHAERRQPQGMSIAEAKRALSASLGVPEEAITITVAG
jgi:hypothetical protein